MTGSLCDEPVNLYPGIRLALLIRPGAEYNAMHALAVAERWSLVESRAANAPDVIEAADVAVLYSSTITPSLIGSVAGLARTYRKPRLLVLGGDRDPQRIADVLRAGADDYLLFPFVSEECAARVRLLASWQPSPARSTHLTFDSSSREIVMDGFARARLTEREWAALVALRSAEERPVSAERLSVLLWGDDCHSSTVASVLSRLRRKLRRSGIDAFMITTVRGKGYVMQPSQAR